MNKIYQTEDSIEQVKFKLAALKIQSGFSTLHELIFIKKLNYFQSFFHKLRTHKNKQLIQNCMTKIEHFSDLIESMEENRKRNALAKMVCIWEKQERRNISRLGSSRQLMRSSGQRSEVECSGIKAMSLIQEEEGWKDKLTMEELQARCNYYSTKIKEVERSFSNFFQKIKEDQ